jgi:pimeloyl-[acyl-carrier protein] methyl ester esterase
VVTEIILQHGWGFDSTAWNGWVPALERKAKVIVGERGYYGLPATTPKFSAAATEKIVVAHSLGLHLIETEVLAQADAVLLLGGFLHFHPTDEVGKKRSQRVISRMRIKLNLDEAAVVNEFWQNAYKPEFATNHLLPAPQIDTEALLRDLDLLDTSKIEPADMAPSVSP